MNALIEAPKTALAFEQQPRESAKAFAAFRAYLDMGPQRSLEAVSRKLGKSKTLLGRWSAKFDWPARVQAFAATVAEHERLAIQAAAVDKAVEWHRLQEPTKREAWEEAKAAIAMVRKAREEWIAKGRLPGWEGMARMLELAFKLKQFATGMPSEMKQVETHVTGQVSVEWEQAIRKAFGLPDGAPVVDVEEVPAEKQKAGSRNLEIVKEDER